MAAVRPDLCLPSRQVIATRPWHLAVLVRNVSALVAGRACVGARLRELPPDCSTMQGIREVSRRERMVGATAGGRAWGRTRSSGAPRGSGSAGDW